MVDVTRMQRVLTMERRMQWSARARWDTPTLVQRCKSIAQVRTSTGGDVNLRLDEGKGGKDKN